MVLRSIVDCFMGMGLPGLDKIKSKENTLEYPHALNSTPSLSQAHHAFSIPIAEHLTK